MSHLRIQKLLYYAQGLSLAYRGRPAFPEEIQAWRHGPVVPDVWRVFSAYRYGQIPDHEAISFDLGDDDAEFITSVWEGYRRYSASALRKMTHRESPWKDARAGLSNDAPSNRPITTESMRQYFEQHCADVMERESGVTIAQLRQGEDDAANGRLVSWREVRKRVVPGAV
jgi:uncharacterized phage-associated protein